MKRLLTVVLCLVCLVLVSSCNNTATPAATPTNTPTSTDPIIGTWICDDINENCFFIFDENGEANAKWGTSTVYGSYDYFEDEDVYDIDVPNFLFNEYKATFTGTQMTLTSSDSKYVFRKATMPKVTIKAPQNLKVDKKLLGNWQSADSFECYEFNEDNTAKITDMYNYAIIECKYTCENGKVTFYYMVTDKKEGNREVEYKFELNKLVLGDYTYENVTGQTQ